ncbi:unnamed protein product [Closterium sp. NIES-54]
MGACPHHVLLVVAFLHRPAAHEGPAVEDGIQAGPRKLYALAGGGSGGGGCGGDPTRRHDGSRCRLGGGGHNASQTCRLPPRRLFGPATPAASPAALEISVSAKTPAASAGSRDELKKAAVAQPVALLPSLHGVLTHALPPLQRGAAQCRVEQPPRAVRLAHHVLRLLSRFFPVVRDVALRGLENPPWVRPDCCEPSSVGPRLHLRQRRHRD